MIISDSYIYVRLNIILDNIDYHYYSLLNQANITQFIQAIIYNK